MPYEDTEGIGLGCIVENMNYPLSVLVGDSLLGKTLDGLGRCVDGFVPEDDDVTTVTNNNGTQTNTQNTESKDYAAGADVTGGADDN